MKIKGFGLKKLIDIVVPAILLSCIIFLNYKGKAIGREYVENAQHALFVQEEGRRRSDKELEDVLIENIRIGTKRIELYDEELKPLFQISFTNSFRNPSVEEFIRLKEIVEREKDRSGSGQATVNIDGTSQSAYYEWLQNSEDEQRLVIVYSSLEKFNDYFYIDFIAYLGAAAAIYLIIREHRETKLKNEDELKNVDKAIEMISRI